MNKFFESAWETIKVIGALIILGYIVNSCSSSSGPQYPGDHTNESAEYQADMSEQDTRNYDPASRYDSLPTDAPDTYEGLDPYGDTACNIKGNITFDGEKIYHLPGQKYYNATEINPNYGERYFCTEAEARAAGWRKSQQ